MLWLMTLPTKLPGLLKARLPRFVAVVASLYKRLCHEALSLYVPDTLGKIGRLFLASAGADWL